MTSAAAKKLGRPAFKNRAHAEGHNGRRQVSMSGLQSQAL